jgi:hypothetical protein
MRQRHALYLSVAMTERLKPIAETHRLSKSEVLERALQACLAAETAVGPAHLLALRQERNERALGRLERDVAIAKELATFVRFFVTITPPLPKSETEAARALGTVPTGYRRHRSTPQLKRPSNRTCSQRTGTDVDGTSYQLMGRFPDRPRRLWRAGVTKRSLAVTQRSCRVGTGEGVCPRARKQLERLERANRAGVKAPFVKEGQPPVCSQRIARAGCAANGPASQNYAAWVSFPRIGRGGKPGERNHG